MKTKSIAQHPGTSSRKLLRLTLSTLIIAAVCLLMQPVIGSPDNPVSRPIKVTNSHGLLIITVEPTSGQYELTDSGEASHLGRFSNSGSGVLDLNTGIFLSGTGTLVAADGDTIDWIVADDAINTVVYTGGTGRFSGVTGRFPVTITSQSLLSINEDGTLTFLMTYEGEGIIAY